MEENKFKPYIPADKVVPELTPFAVVMGVIMSIVFGAANAYLALRVGMTVSASIPAAVISMGVIRFLFRRNSLLENNLVQTIASAGETVAAGMVFTIPALYLWANEGVCEVPSVLDIFIIALCGGAIGIMMMVPLRNALIVQEHGKLAYPEGTACAQVLLAGEEGGSKASTVFAGLGIASVYKLFTDGFKLFPSEVDYSIRRLPGAGIGMDALPSMLGVGYICGWGVSAQMFAGGVLSWFVLMPLFVLLGGDTVIFPATVSVAELWAEGGTWEIWSRFIRYIGAGALAAGGIISVIKSMPMIVRTFAATFRSKGAAARSSLRTEQDLPLWLLPVVILAAVLVLWLWPGVDISAGGLVLIVVLGFFFTVVASRLVGLIGSSNNPVSGMTIAALLVATFFLLATGVTGSRGMVSAILIGSVVCVIVSVSSDTSQDLKTGFLLGATPRTQQIGELIGVVASAAAIGAVLNLLNTAWGFGTGELGAPQAMMMKMIVEGVMGGNMPWTLVFLGVFLAVVLELLGLPILPVAIGVYLPVHMTAGIMLGGLVREIVDRLPLGKNADREEGVQAGILYSSGLIAGEGLVGIVLAVLTVLGVNIDLSGVFSLGNAGTLVLYGLLALSLIFVARRNGEKK